MAMRYINVNKLLAVAAASFLLAGCFSKVNTVKKNAGQSVSVKPAAAVMRTESYIPSRAKSPETGEILPYVKMPNPYLGEKQQLDAQAVAKFIQIKRNYSSKQYKQALKLIDELTKKYRTLSGPWVVKGDIENKRRQTEKAISSYQSAIKVNKNNVNAYLKLAKVQREAGKFIDAQNTYASALKLWRDFPEAHLNLAVLYDVYLNQPVKAQRHMEAYQFLTKGRNKQVAKWLNEIQGRTGTPVRLKVERRKAISGQPKSQAGGSK